MSRSYRKTPVSGITCADSEKQDKRIANRRYRRRAQQAVHHEKEIFPLVREVSNVWTFDKDGKVWWGWRINEGMWDIRRIMFK